MLGSGLWGTETPTHPHLIVGPGGIAKEVRDVRLDLNATLSPLLAVTVEEYDGASPALPTAIMPVTATSLAALNYAYAALTGSIGDGAIVPPRNIEVVTAGTTPVHAPASFTITGLDAHGRTLTETITGTNGGAATYTGVKCFAKVTSVSAPAGTGVDATFSVGTGAIIGLSQTPLLRTGQSLPLVRRELVDGAVVTTGVLTLPTTNPPFGAYTPATAPIASTAAVVTGTASISSALLYGPAGTLNGLTVILTVNGVVATLTLAGAGNAVTLASFLSTLAKTWPGASFTVNASGHLVITDLSAGSTFSIIVGAGTANTLLGLTAATTAGTGHSYAIEYEFNAGLLPDPSLPA